MKRPIRHIWDDGSTHRAVAGDEYDLVWDYAEELEADLERLKDIANKEHAQSAHTAMRNGELEAEVERSKGKIVELARWYELKTGHERPSWVKAIEVGGE